MIVYKDTAHAPELADRQGIRSADLAAAGIVDHIVAEASPDQLLPDLGRLLRAELTSLTGTDDVARLDRRQRKYRRLGAPRGGSPSYRLARALEPLERLQRLQRLPPLATRSPRLARHRASVTRWPPAAVRPGRPGRRAWPRLAASA